MVATGQVLGYSGFFLSKSFRVFSFSLKIKYIVMLKLLDIQKFQEKNNSLLIILDINILGPILCPKLLFYQMLWF